MAKRARKKPPRSRFVLRWLAVGAIVLVGLLYARPLRSYLNAKHDLTRRATEVQTLKTLGLVRPGERLFIVKGVPAWLRGKATIDGGGR